MNSNQSYIKITRDIKPPAAVFNKKLSVPDGQVDGANLDDETRTESVSSLKSRFEQLNQQQSSGAKFGPKVCGGVNINGPQTPNKPSFPNITNLPRQQHKQQQQQTLHQNESFSDLTKDESSKTKEQGNSYKPSVANLIASNNALKPPKPALPLRSPTKPIISRSTSPSYSNNPKTDLKMIEDHHDPFDDSQGIDPFADDNDLANSVEETTAHSVRAPRTKIRGYSFRDMNGEDGDDSDNQHVSNNKFSAIKQKKERRHTEDEDDEVYVPRLPPKNILVEDEDSENGHYASSTQKKANKGSKPPLPGRPQMPPPPLPNRPPSLRSQTGIKQHKIVSENNPTDSNSTSEAPDLTKSNRRPPKFKGIKEINNKGTTRAFEITGKFIITDSGHTRVWSLDSGDNINTISHEDTKITCLCWRPTRRIEDVGRFIWGGGQDGNIFAIEIHGEERYLEMARKAHGYPVNFILRHEFQLWSLDDGGKLLIWSEDGGVVSLRSTPKSIQLVAKQTCALVVGHHLWTAAGKTIEVFNPLDENRVNIKKIEIGIDMGNVKCMTQTDNSSLVYVGHEDGNVTAWNAKTFNRVLSIKVSVYNITSLLGVGDYLWVGFKTGKIYIYDVTKDPWMVVKDWKAHKSPVVEMHHDEDGLWKVNRLQVASCSAEGQIKVWDGLMGQDWIADEMIVRGREYCKYREIKVLICSWNIDASKPSDLERSHDATKFLRLWFTSTESPDIIVIGFQEIIDLESGKQTAKTILTKKKTEKQNAANLTQRYKAWRDKLVKAVREYTAYGEKYEVISSEYLVGLFTCIFVKESERKHVKNIDIATKKTGLKGYHGNKGSIATRFTYDDSSMCFVNCHLAAGQTQITARNTDAANILDTTEFSIREVNESVFVHGGDGTAISDHEICFFSGDLNYRIDLPREQVLEAVEEKNFALLWEHDQLFRQRSSNPGFRLLPFSEGVPNFAPTYKYNPGEDEYDTSEKRRTPAWCDRILYRGPRIKQEHYRRYECNVSDHRPISGAFKVVVKTILRDKQLEVEREVEKAWEKNVEKEKSKIKAKLLKTCGFDHATAVKALKETNGNLMRAFDMLKSSGTRSVLDEGIRRKRNNRLES
ncbi:14345_t:CDS:2 [Acaulospora colombiana]|uniref:14345_t:CDS:1 n=1 Tax=Acaulospora colombiana TaxID=27376 RepID=A0ACA9KPB0_9GLOM|nr:14345_t:CDS:2 [Acaulospora colombiana]